MIKGILICVAAAILIALFISLLEWALNEAYARVLIRRIEKLTPPG